MTSGELIRHMLREVGPMTAREVTEATGLNHDLTRVRLCSLKASGHIHVTEYRRETVHGRLYPRAVYALGPGRDAKKPGPLTQAEYCRRYRARKRNAVPSVFHLGGNIDQARVAVDWRRIWRNP